MGRVERITKALKEYDSFLYCEKHEEGKLCVFRRSQRTESYNVDGVMIHFIRPAPHFVFALTDNWKLQGISVDWGIDPIMNKVRECDLWQRNLAEESIRSVEKGMESKKRDLKNNNEAFIKDWRRPFAKMFNDYNISSMKKIDSRRLGEKNGNC